MADIKKIMYFLDFAYFLGGSNRVLLTQAYIMKRKGYEVKVVKPIQEDYAEECNEICRKYNLEILNARYTISTCMENIDILEVIEEYKDIVKLLEEHRPNIIHSAQLNIAVELAARVAAIPHLMNIYQVDQETFNLNWIDIYPQYHSADSFLFSQRWGRGLKIASRCIRVAYEKGKTDGKHIKGIERETITILSIGVLCERKNQMELIKFALRCSGTGENIKVIFLGDYSNIYGRKCREFVNENGLENCIIFKGFVLNIEDYFKEADLFILSSTVESYPGVIVESMANHVPIISTPVAGVPELLINEQNGFLAEGYKSEQIYEAFLRYLAFRRNGQIAQIVENAYNTYLENHTYGAVGNQLEDYYKWIVQDYNGKKFSYLTADEVGQKFQGFIIERKIDKIPPIMRNRIWFIYHILLSRQQKDNKRIVIWGAGFWGRQVLEWLHILGEQSWLVGFIDINKRGTYLDYPIFQDKDRILEDCGTIFVALENPKAISDVMKCLENRGKVRNQDYFLACNSPLIRI